MRSSASRGSSCADLGEAERLLRRPRERLRESGPHLRDDPVLEHRIRALPDASLEDVARDRQPADQRRVTRCAAPQSLLPRDERPAGLRQLERTDQALPIVGVNRLGGCRVDLGEASVGGGTVGVDLTLDPPPQSRIGGRRNLEIGQRGSEVEARSPATTATPRAPDDLVDLGVRQRGERTDAHLLTECADPDEPRRPRRLVGEDRKPAVDLHRVGRYDLRAEAVRDRFRDGALSRGGGTEDRDDLHAKRTLDLDVHRLSEPTCRRSPVRRGLFGHDRFGRLLGHRPPPHALSLTSKP